MTSKETRNLHVGLVGAGLGGLVAAIALRLAGAEVTVLEAAAVLGDIGAGIQMTPNVARLLQKWGKYSPFLFRPYPRAIGKLREVC